MSRVLEETGGRSHGGFGDGNGCDIIGIHGAVIGSNNEYDENNHEDQYDDIVDGRIIAVEPTANGTIHNVIRNDDAVKIACRGILRGRLLLLLMVWFRIIGMFGGKIRLDRSRSRYHDRLLFHHNIGGGGNGVGRGRF